MVAGERHRSWFASVHRFDNTAPVCDAVQPQECRFCRRDGHPLGEELGECRGRQLHIERNAWREFHGLPACFLGSWLNGEHDRFFRENWVAGEHRSGSGGFQRISMPRIRIGGEC